MEQATLVGERVRLRPPTDGDDESIAAAICDPDIPYWIDVIPWPYTRADARHFINEIASDGWASGKQAVWLITPPDGAEVCGAVGLTHRLPGVFELGYWLTPSARGRGLMTEAARLACDFAFDHLHAQRVEWQAAVGNVRSRAVAERLGFRFEARARHRLSLAGRPHDSWLASLLPHERATDPVKRLVPSAPVEVVGDGVVLRVPDPALSSWVLSAYRDPQISVWNPAEVNDDDAALRWIEDRADWTDGDHASWIFSDAESGAPLGAVSLHKVNTENLSASVGYWTHPKARRRGHATAALAAATSWAFNTLKLRRIELLHAVDNPGSCRVAMANLYELEGTTRQGERYGDGQWHDEHIHGRISDVS